MTTIAQIILAIALVLSIILPFGYYLIGEKNRGRYKTALGVNALLLLPYRQLQALKAHLQQVWVISQQLL